jgi:hypothetical protein
MCFKRDAIWTCADNGEGEEKHVDDEAGADEKIIYKLDLPDNRYALPLCAIHEFEESRVFVTLQR